MAHPCFRPAPTLKDDNHLKMKANVKVWFSDVCTGVLQEIMLQVAFIITSEFA